MDYSYHGKSAKMWVNEICVKQLVQAKYETKEKVPPEIPPVFICRCVIKYTDKTLQAEASGKTKKEAEQGAAAEMLFKNMQMTSAKLMALAQVSRKSTSGSVAPTAQLSEEKSSENVSDTDDDVLNSSINPIGDLIGICATHDFDVEPSYEVVNEEGPPHRKVFTVKCELVVPKKNIDLSSEGRRPKKQTAKKLAALRLLREMNKLGYRYEQHQEKASDTDNSPEMDDPVIRTISSGLENLDITCNDRSRLSSLISSSVGIRKYCDDPTQNCLELCTDYQHAFCHLKKSTTLDDLLSEADLQKSIKKFGGAIPLMEKIAKELDVSIVWYRVPSDELKGDSQIVFMQLKFPFKFKYLIPPKTTHAGSGLTKDQAKIQAAIKGLEFLKLMFTNERV